MMIAPSALRFRRSGVLLGLLLAAMAACAGPNEARDSAAGMNGPPPSGELADLAQRYWDTYLRLHPEQGTTLGDHRFDAAVSDDTPAGKRAAAEAFGALKQEADDLDAASLGRADRVTLAMLNEALDEELLAAESDANEWEVDPLSGPQVAMPNLIRTQQWSEVRGQVDLVTRIEAQAGQVDAATAALARGLESGRTAPRAAVEKALSQLDELLAKEAGDWPWVTNALVAGAEAPERIRDLTRAELVRVVEQSLRPAFVRYRDRLREDVLPRARSNEQPGLKWMSGGEELYRKQVRRHTSLDLPPQEIHDYGLSEIARIRAEITELGRKVFGTEDFAATQARLMNDPVMFFTTRDEVEAKARESLERAAGALDGYFGIQPRTPCRVERIPAYEEANSTMAYYRGPAADGSRSGTYFINTYQPEIRPRYNAEVLAYHEAIPGHHLQIAIAVELRGIPEFRKHLGCTAFVEGWALYTERLCNEMGLYSGDLDRFGMLGFDAWRAARLVVDTGMHAFGWSRERAIQYMQENTLTAYGNIVNEVDRYIAWPGQALAYKLGQREILALRAEAKAALGEDFDLAEFHDVVLRDGAVTLPVLRQNVEAWLATRD